MGDVWKGPVLAFVFAKFSFPKTVESGCAVTPGPGASSVKLYFKKYYIYLYYF